MRRLAALGLLGILGSCASESTTAGGGGFGGETLSGVVVGASGKGIAGAVMRLRASGSLEATALGEERTDSTGRFRIEYPAGTALRLEVAGIDGTDSVKALVDLDPGQSPGRILAEKAKPRGVQLRDVHGAGMPGRIQAYGLGYAIETDDSGRADLSRWPNADLWTKVTLRSGESRDLFVPANANGTLVVESGWLLDDFEGQETRTRLGLLAGGGWWYVASMAADTPSARDIATMRDALDAMSGSSLRAFFTLPTSGIRYGLVGFHFGVTDARPVDLSGMDSLVFWAKGGGNVRVEMVADTGGGVTSHAFIVQLDSTWKRYVVAASALFPIDAGRKWAVDSKRVRFLQFIVFESADFRLDDLRYYGRALP
jgi:hypothetical protein